MYLVSKKFSRISELFLPHLFVKNINNICFRELRKVGIDTIIFDKDDTLCRHGEVNLHELISLSLLKEALCDLEYQIHVLSNSQNSFKLELGPWSKDAFCRIPTIKKKPFNTEELEIWLRREKGPLKNFSSVAIVGDRLLTDVLLANRLGAMSILVRPFTDSKPSLGSRLLIWGEQLFLDAIKAKGIVRRTHHGHLLTEALLRDNIE